MFLQAISISTNKIHPSTITFYKNFPGLLCPLPPTPPPPIPCPPPTYSIAPFCPYYTNPKGYRNVPRQTYRYKSFEY